MRLQFAFQFALCLSFTLAAKLDIIGYYGNSGNAVGSIPRLTDIHPNYNVLILTFADLDAQGNITLDIQGPYENDLAGLAADVPRWKAMADPFGRQRVALFSIGGQNGRWPADVSADALLASFTAFMKQYSLDGLDIDLEGSAVSAATSLIPVVQTLTGQGKIVTAAPEAAQGPLTGYADLNPHLTWAHPQFYNNGPNAVADPYLPSADLWPTPWTVTDWQDEKNATSFWGGVLAAIGQADGMTQAQLGMLIPATPAAAGQYNNWDISKLQQEVAWAGISHVGTWAIAYDNLNSYKFAITMGQLNL